MVVPSGPRAGMAGVRLEEAAEGASLPPVVSLTCSVGGLSSSVEACPFVSASARPPLLTQ